MKIAVENLFWKDKLRDCYYGIFPTPREMTEFVDSLGSPYFVVCCDLGHAAITGLAPEIYISGMENRLLTCTFRIPISRATAMCYPTWASRIGTPFAARLPK